MENAARRGGTTVSALLDRITKEWIVESQPGHINDDAEQQRLHAKVRKTLGTISGQDTRQAERARVDVRKRLFDRAL